MAFLETVQPYVDLLAGLATAAGGIAIVLGILVYFADKRKAKQDLEQLVYDAPHREYIDYLRLCLENPELDVSDIPRGKKSLADHKKDLVFVILVSMLERAYLLYNTTHQVPTQWKGWESYIRDWCARPDFQVAWKDIGGQFDQRFVTFVDSCLPDGHRIGRAA